MLGTAEVVLDEVAFLLRRLKAVGERAVDSDVSRDERRELQDEAFAIVSEITMIGSRAQVDGKPVFDSANSPRSLCLDENGQPVTADLPTLNGRVLGVERPWGHANKADGQPAQLIHSTGTLPAGLFRIEGSRVYDDHGQDVAKYSHNRVDFGLGVTALFDRSLYYDDAPNAPQRGQLTLNSVVYLRNPASAARALDVIGNATVKVVSHRGSLGKVRAKVEAAIAAVEAQAAEAAPTSAPPLPAAPTQPAPASVPPAPAVPAQEAESSQAPAAAANPSAAPPPPPAAPEPLPPVDSTPEPAAPVPQPAPAPAANPAPAADPAPAAVAPPRPTNPAPLPEPAWSEPAEPEPALPEPALPAETVARTEPALPAEPLEPVVPAQPVLSQPAPQPQAAAPVPPPARRRKAAAQPTQPKQPTEAPAKRASAPTEAAQAAPATRARKPKPPRTPSEPVPESNEPLTTRRVAARWS